MQSTAAVNKKAAEATGKIFATPGATNKKRGRR
jgi:hypothetical protein